MSGAGPTPGGQAADRQDAVVRWADLTPPARKVLRDLYRYGLLLGAAPSVETMAGLRSRVLVRGGRANQALELTGMGARVAGWAVAEGWN